jgi:hypothetical protein
VSVPGGTERPAFDPRHDARFQRGYRPGDGSDDTDGEATPVRRVRASRPATAAAPRAREGVTVVPHAAADPAPEPPGADVDDPDDLDELSFDANAFLDEPEPSRWNPFIALLWVLGPAFVLPAIAVQYLSATFSYSSISYNGSGPMPFGMLIQQLGYAVAPSLLTAGLVIIAGLLFWHAAAWRARRRPLAPR